MCTPLNLLHKRPACHWALKVFMTNIINMILDWPFGTVCAILMYIGLVYIMMSLLRHHNPCPYEFEVLER